METFELLDLQNRDLYRLDSRLRCESALYIDMIRRSAPPQFLRGEGLGTPICE
jgi:hypothetical protein